MILNDYEKGIEEALESGEFKEDKDI